MASVITAMGLQSGKTASKSHSLSITQPIQMLPRDEKGEEWQKQNMDWYEQIGLKQLRLQAKRMLKNYRLAKGIIDKSDYIVQDGNEYSELIHQLTKDDDSDSALSIKFYPIIPNVINVLVGEFSKRSNKIMVRAVDEYSKNEKLEAKKQEITNYLLLDAQVKIAQNLQAQGIDMNSEEAQEALEGAKSLPEIEEMFRKSYTSIPEQWANYQLAIDEERFKMYEKENEGFRDSLIVDREFWHIRLLEDDYEVELWNPINVFYHKSPDTRYISEGNYVGRILMMSVPDVIDRYGYRMDDDQIKSLESIHQVSSKMVGEGHDYTAYYDTSKPYTDQYPNSVHYEKLMTQKSMLDDIIGSDDFHDFIFGDTFDQGMVRVTEVYWKSQRRVGWLTKIDLEGNITKSLVTEDYKITEKPIYDTSVFTQKTKKNLVLGEHIDWLWINQVWKGIKIGATFSTTSSDFDPIYLDVEPLEFQFKGTDNPFNAKLPVEGCIYSDRNTRSSSLVDLMKPYQILYNLANNQISDIQIDELGTVILIDHRFLPSHSMGEEWGRGNMAKAYRAMKDFSILPIDAGVENLGGPAGNYSFQKMELEQTNRLLTRLKVSEYAKFEAFSVVGVTPQRLGDTAASETATGNQIALNNSYSQTEHYFTQHQNFLMPRVKQMMIDAAQYFTSRKPSVRLAYTTSRQEELFLEMEDNKLMLRDFNIYCMSRPDSKTVLDQLKQLAINNNTSGANLYDLARVMESQSITEVMDALKVSVQNLQGQEQQKMSAEQELHQKELEAEAYEAEIQRIDENQRLDKQLQNNIDVAEIRAMGYAKDTDMNSDQVPDVLEVDTFKQQIDSNKMALERKKHEDSIALEKQKMDLERKKLETQKEIERLKLLNPVAGEKSKSKTKKKKK